MYITALYRYPVKSLRGTATDSLDIEPWGPAGDRRWAVVDEIGERVTARELPQLLALSATALVDGGVRVVARDGSGIEVSPPAGAAKVPVSRFRGVDHAPEAGRAAEEFLTKALGRPLRLVWQDAPQDRPIPDKLGRGPGEPLSLADAGPLLLTSDRSLERLQSWVGGEPVLSMRRFRPNVVVDGAESFEEDAWRRIRLGAVEFHACGPCDRCVMTTVDPDTQAKGPEPIRTLARHRRWDGKTWFGIWLVPAATGSIQVTDPVRVLE